MTPAELSRRARELFALDIEGARATSLVRFAELVRGWAERMNLVSAGSRDAILSRHVLDSLAAVPLLAGAHRIVDVGSGAGFPGVPLAITMPEARFDLVESRRKRASFLRHVVRSLSLANVVVHEMRAEEWRGGEAVDATIARAIRGETLADVSRAVLRAGGHMILMKKEGGDVAPSADFEEERAIRYRLPEGERHEVISFRRRFT